MLSEANMSSFIRASYMPLQTGSLRDTYPALPEQINAGYFICFYLIHILFSQNYYLLLQSQTASQRPSHGRRGWDCNIHYGKRLLDALS